MRLDRLPLFRSKRPPPSALTHLLGEEVSLLLGSIRTCATVDRAQKLRGIASRISPGDFLTPAGAIKLRGGIGFYTPLHLRRVGRCAMGPLIRWQYGTHAAKLTPILERNLLWRVAAVGSLPPRSIPLHLSSPVGDHSDAQGLGHISARALLHRGFIASLHLPRRRTDMPSELEGDHQSSSSNLLLRCKRPALRSPRTM